MLESPLTLNRAISCDAYILFWLEIIDYQWYWHKLVWLTASGLENHFLIRE